MEGKTKTPREETLRQIWDFVTQYEIIGPSSPVFIQEPTSDYNSKSIEDKIAEKVLEKLKPYLKNLKNID